MGGSIKDEIWKIAIRNELPTSNFGDSRLLMAENQLEFLWWARYIGSRLEWVPLLETLQ